MTKNLIKFALYIILVFCFITGFTKCAFGQYKVTIGKVAGWSVLAVGGFADGAVEGYQIDGRTSFERKWDVNPYGYWGSESWRKIYVDGDPAKGYVSKWAHWRGASDFYHHADDTRKLCYIGGSTTVALSGKNNNTKWWHYAIDLGISLTVTSASKSIGYKWVRN